VNMKNYETKEIFVFDLDGTLAESKSNIDKETATLLEKILTKKKIAVISGGTFSQIKKAVVSKLNLNQKKISNLSILPTSGSSFFQYENKKWKKIYSQKLSKEEMEKIIGNLRKSLSEAGYKKPRTTYGEIIENRKTQITFSGLGQKAPLEAKLAWDPQRTLRKKIVKLFEKLSPDFETRIGGSTSIDINKKGLDKSFGIEQIKRVFDLGNSQILFVGDALFPGGNDYAVKKTKVETLSVKDPEETKKYLREIIDSI